MANLTKDTKVKTDKPSDPHSYNLYHILSRNAGTGPISAFIELWKDASSKNDDSSLKGFFSSLGLLDHDANNFSHLKLIFESIYKQGLQMRNEIEDIDSNIK